MKKFRLHFLTFCFGFIIFSNVKAQNLISLHNVNNLSDLSQLSPGQGSIINVSNLGIYQYDGALWQPIKPELDTSGLATAENIIASYQTFIQGCDFCAVSYEIGDTLDCGIVVHTNTDGQHGLIMALDDEWSSSFDCSSDEYNGAPINAFMENYGLVNSISINDSCPASAASDCLNYNPCGNGGWYMPAKDELTLMFMNYQSLNIALSNLGKPLISNTSFYWSSSKETDFGSWFNSSTSLWEFGNLYLGTAAVIYDSQSWSNSRSDALDKSEIHLVRPFKSY